ncbi:glycosyltransferase [Sorangium sp. So ce269]
MVASSAGEGFSPSSVLPLRHAVVIATTTERRELLERALRSVAAQIRAPERLVVVIDRQADCDVDARGTILPEGLDTPVDLLFNRRRPGAAGAWNTAIDHLARHERSPEGTLVSFLDDDDWWEPNHLARVEECAVGGAEVIATPLVRHDERTPEGRTIAPPNVLRAEDFLVGNSGIQGSNLSARLSTLLEAGCFDESLLSCTDRDLCIRFAQIGAVYAAAKGGAAHHDTLHGGPRLSDPGSPAKVAGLNAFFGKYAWPMTAGERERAEQRARDLFGWEPQKPPARPAPALRAPQTTGSLDLVVGVIVDGGNPARALPLLDGLARLRRHARVRRLEVVLLENGAPAGFDEVVAHGRTLGLLLWPARVDAQRRVCGELGLDEEEVTERKSIAVARFLLHRFAYEVARPGDQPAVWILDDDARITGCLDLLVDDIVRARDSGIDVLIGGVTGAPPIPAGAALRTQLVDLQSFLWGAARHASDEPPPEAEPVNRRFREGRRDYYHDLARRETGHLETPFLPEATAPDLASSVAHVLGRSERILAGEQLFRALPAPEGDPLAHAFPSSFRGGNTLIFDLDLLRDVPNLAPRVAGRRLRRSDMNWAAIARLARGRNVVAAPIVVEHDRSSDPIEGPSHEKLLDDLLGYAFFRAFEEHLGRLDRAAPSRLTEDDRARIRSRTRKYAVERFAAYRLAFHRVRGIVRAFERLLGMEGPERPWWLASGLCHDALRGLVRRLREGFTLDALHASERRLEERLSDPGVDAFLDAISPALRGEPAKRGPAWETWIDETRCARARALCQRLGFEADDLLGMGGEGVVLRAGDRALKVFDRWSDADRAAHLGKLHHLVRDPVSAFPRVICVHDEREAVVLEVAYEPSEAYEGGRGPLVVELLRSLRASGWVHTNLHPRNLRVTARGLIIVDLGRSLAPATPEGEEGMARRAHLAFRFAWRQDLAALMRRSIEDGDFPELVGWERLVQAVRAGSVKERLDAELARRIREIDPRRLLDFGCGKPRCLPSLAEGREMAVFDPDASLARRWAVAAPGIPFLDEASLAATCARGEVFDIVVCSLVLCAVDDDAVRVALGRIRCLVAPEGRVLVALCDPTSHQVRTTTFQHRIDAGAIPYEVSSRYTKQVEGAATTRFEYHRPLAAYRRMFARAGLAVSTEWTVDGIDVERFERVSEFVVFELEPLGALQQRTSLLIKACAQESETIRAQVEHIVRQLGAPRAFDEVVVLVDPYEGPFPREHHVGDLAKLRQSLEVLDAAGIVDRVIEGPRDGERARAVAERWFGLGTAASHSENGQPVLGILEAIEQASGDLIFHADVDLMVARPDLRFDLIADALSTFEAEPEAVALSLPVLGDTVPMSRRGDARGPYRVDAAAGWIHRGRLLALRPLPNEVRRERLALPWHRSLDRVVQEGRALSLRRGAPGIFCACPDNARKHSVDRHLLLLDRMEAGYAPIRQTGRMELVGSLSDWLGPKRDEPMVIVICGRNVPPGRIHRCLDSLAAQRGVAWGAIVIDDASDSGADEVLRRAATALGARATYLRRRQRAGLMANTTLAVRELCSNPDSVIVLLDLDDALGASDALATVQAAHADGADVTVGSMVRTDKQASYPVDFMEPRHRRGGNVWQHLRSFRKALFDRIELADLKLDGSWIDLSSDWAMMVPIVEMAKRPEWIRRPLYLHEPSGPRTPAAREEREELIARTMALPSYRSPARAARLRPGELTVLCYHRIDGGSVSAPSFYQQRGMVVSRRAFEAQVRSLARRFEPISLDDLGAAARDERSLPERAAVVAFDDGYRDLLDVALPALERAGIPAIAFSRVPGAGGLPSWAPLDLLYHGLAIARARGATVPVDLADEMREALLCAPQAQQIEMVLDVVRSHGVDTAMLGCDTLYLDHAGLRELQAAGVALGAHGVEHVRWTLLSDGHLESELAASVSWLQSLGTRQPLALAYPDACCDRRVARAAERAGFLLGFGLGTAPPDVPERLCIRRRIAEDDPLWIDRMAMSLDQEAQ